jgi:hypothetical protein
MLAARRFFFLSTLSVWLCLVSSSPLLAQSPYMEFHGIPPSGIGGANAAFSAVRPNGAAGIGCCAGFFFPSSFSPMVPYPSFATEKRSHRGHHRRRGHEGEGTAVEPVYIPFGVPYAVDAEDDAADETYAAEPEAGEPARPARRRTSVNGVPEVSEHAASGNVEVDSRDGAGSVAEAGPEVAPDPPEPVVAQPTTLLVFKDGHRSEVGNYAIVGDTLFDFSGDRARKILIADLDITATQKANDTAGVEFKLPPPGMAN